MIVFLPGFLGTSEDFEVLQKKSLLLKQLPWDSVPLFEKKAHKNFPIPLVNFCDFPSLTDELSDYFSRQSPRLILLAYSFGARLALNWLLRNPSKISAAILISPHLGLSTEEERFKRYQEVEKSWENYLENNGLEAFVKFWETLGPGQDMKSPDSLYPKRNLQSLCPQKVLWALKNFSLSRQPNFETRLHEIQIPVLWITGKQDKKYDRFGSLASSQNCRIQHQRLTEAGHRAVWDKPQEALAHIEVFLKKVLDPNSNLSKV